MVYREPQGAPGRPRLVKGTEGRLWAIFVGGDRQPQSGSPGLQLQFRIYTVTSWRNGPKNRDLWCFGVYKQCAGVFWRHCQHRARGRLGRCKYSAKYDPKLNILPPIELPSNY